MQVSPTLDLSRTESMPLPMAADSSPWDQPPSLPWWAVSQVSADLTLSEMALALTAEGAGVAAAGGGETAAGEAAASEMAAGGGLSAAMREAGMAAAATRAAADKRIDWVRVMTFSFVRGRQREVGRARGVAGSRFWGA